MSENAKPAQDPAPGTTKKTAKKPAAEPQRPREIGGPKGPEPTRYGDWEHKGIVTDF